MDTTEERIVAARLKLRQRYLDKMAATPAQSDTQPQGKGPANRHGMPQVPSGQKLVVKWPILDLGRRPAIPLDKWQLRIDGACANPLSLNWEAFRALEQTDDASDFHCVTGWSKLDMSWQGVKLADLAALAEVSEEATHVLCYGYDGYTTNLPLEEALKLDVMLAHTVDGEPLAREHGGPVRMITPQLYAWKGAKWICRIEFMVGDKLGYWERNGYSNTAHPWREDRYAPNAHSADPSRLAPFLAPMLLWMGGVLLLSCAALAYASLHHMPELALWIKVLSCLAAFGAIPFAIRTAR